MRRWMRTTGLVAALGTIAAAVWMQACSSQQKGAERRSVLESAGTPVEPWRSIGLPQNSPGIAAGSTSNGFPARPGEPSLTALGDSAVNLRGQLHLEGFETSTPSPAPIQGPLDFVLRPGEELWVIERRTTFATPTSDDFPGCGSLMTQVRDESRISPRLDTWFHSPSTSSRCRCDVRSHPIAPTALGTPKPEKSAGRHRHPPSCTPSQGPRRSHTRRGRSLTLTHSAGSSDRSRYAPTFSKPIASGETA